MGNLGSVLTQLKEERKQTQQQVDKLNQAISVIEGLVNGTKNVSAPLQTANSTGGHAVSAATRRKLSLAQKARWANAKKPALSIAPTAVSIPTPTKFTMSPAARRKIAAAQRLRWAKIKSASKKAA